MDAADTLIKPRLLVVDDDQDIRDFMGMILGDFGHVTVAGSYEEAVSVCTTQRYDIYMFDYRLPGHTGLELLDYVRSLDSHAKVIMVTGFGDKQVLIESLRRGAFDFLEKPMSIEAIKASCRRILMQRSLERGLQHTSRLSVLGTLASTIVHEIKNPLYTIGLVSELLQQSVANNKRALELVERIRRSTKRINRICELVRRQSQHSSEKDVEDIRTLIRNAVEMMAERATSCRTRLTVDTTALDLPSEPSYLISGDLIALEGAFINLITNSLDAFEERKIPAEKRLIHLVLKAGEGMAEVSVTDTAGGIPEDIITKVFQPYFTTKGKTTGTGIGLWYVKQTIENHNGTVRLIVRTDQGETCFKIGLPIFYHPEKPVAITKT
jgi:signal transduction histidine kinase